ncbi:MAG: DUF4845 domain-containing protein [Thiohalophilus sp.]
MKSIREQKGLGAIGWLSVLALIAICALLFLKIVPTYMNSMTIGSILSGMEEDPDMGSKSPGELSVILTKRLNVNSITDVGRDEVYIERGPKGTVVEVDYEVRKKLVGNIDVVMSFNKRAEIPR